MSTRLREETAEAILSLLDSARTIKKLGNALSSVGPVVHEEQVNVAGVVDEESLVAGGHHVPGLLVAAVTDLAAISPIFPHLSWSIRLARTEGMGMFDLKRLRTRLSIPLGLRHDSGTHLKRSDWWRQKRLVPVELLVVERIMLGVVSSSPIL